MNLEWVQWSNPVARWWIFLVSVSTLNFILWFVTQAYLTPKIAKSTESQAQSHTLIWLAFIYVAVCAFRSILPRADVQRIVLFDTFWSSVFVGRSVATVAELSFVAQWAIVLNLISKVLKCPLSLMISRIIVPLIFMAECFSWSAVITTNYLGNTIEESTWTLTYALIIIAVFKLLPKTQGALKYTGIGSIFCLILYLSFMTRVDVPMYFHRWQADTAAGKPYFSFSQGISDLLTHWKVTYSIEDWRTEIPWLSLYFSLGVWASLLLCYAPVTRKELEPYTKL